MATLKASILEKRIDRERRDARDASFFDHHVRHRLSVLDTDISYVDVGRGDPIVFLHGNPTWSYIWRRVIPYASVRGRCLAPDLVGMGQSGKSPRQAYRFFDHVRYLDAWFDALELRRNVTLVLHDWGSALGFHWAQRHPDRVRATAYMEAIVQPRFWRDFPPGRDTLFRQFRSTEGERKVLRENAFIETVLPQRILRTLTPQELDAYRRPYPNPDSRLPMLALSRELPIEGEPSDIVATVEEYGSWLAASPVPKLFVNADPGSLLIGRGRAFCRTWPNQREVIVRGIHFIQEDSPAEIGTALERFLGDVRDAA